MEFDDFLADHIGEIGTFQILAVCYIGLLSVPAALEAAESVFQAEVIDHWCLPDNFPSELYLNLSRSQLQTLVAPPGERYGRQCHTLERNYSSVHLTGATFPRKPNDSELLDAPLKPCNKWMYPLNRRDWTTITQWDLVCGRAWMGPLQSSSYMVGLLIGAFTSGILSDRFGRRPMALVGLIGQVLARVALAFSPNITVFCFFKFMTAAFVMTWYTCSYVQSMEVVGVKWRILNSVVSTVGFGVGYCLLGITAFLERHWKRLTLVNTVYLAPFFILTWLVPESPRWLYANGRKGEADVIMCKMARINRRRLPDSWHINIKRSTNSDKESSNPLDLIKIPELRRITVINCLIWMVCTLVFYGILFNSPNLAGSVYLNLALNGLMQPVSVCVIGPLYNSRLGRRLSLSAVYTICGLALVLCSLVPKDLGSLTVCLVMIGKCGMAGAYAILYSYTPELMPTVLRNAGMGTASMSGRIAGILAPFIASLGEYSQAIPNIILGAAALGGAFVTLLLPETRGRRLPETIADSRRFAQSEPFCRRGNFASCKRSSNISVEKEYELEELKDTATDTSPQTTE